MKKEHEIEVMRLKDDEVILHGECMVKKGKLPEGAKKVKTGKVFIVADSETTGNHHVVDTPKGVDVYEANGTYFMVAEVPTQIRCVMADRHDAVKLDAGTYEFGAQQEFDPFTARLQKVRD